MNQFRAIWVTVLLFGTLSGCQSVPQSGASFYPDIPLPVVRVPLQEGHVQTAIPEIDYTQSLMAKQTNNRFDNTFAGNFSSSGYIDFITQQSPRAYVDYLWGQKNPDPQEGWRRAQKENWKDEIKFMSSSMDPGKAWQVESRLLNPEELGLHCGTIVVGNLNQDGIDDALIACSGYDHKPYPGEHSFLMLSDERGKFRLKRLTSRRGSYEGATSMDLNSDGLLDVILSDSSEGHQVVAGYINLGGGNFGQEQILLDGLRHNITVGAVDLNDDGYAELIVGGGEYDRFVGKNPTMVYWNDGSGTFSKIRKTTLPTVADYSIVMDILVERPYIFLVRTSREYLGGAIQQIDIRDFSEVATIRHPNVRHPSRLHRVYSPSGKVVFGSLDCDRNGVDFILAEQGEISFVRETDGERTSAGCSSVTP